MLVQKQKRCNRISCDSTKAQPPRILKSRISRSPICGPISKPIVLGFAPVSLYDIYKSFENKINITNWHYHAVRVRTVRDGVGATTSGTDEKATGSISPNRSRWYCCACAWLSNICCNQKNIYSTIFKSLHKYLDTYIILLVEIIVSSRCLCRMLLGCMHCSLYKHKATYKLQLNFTKTNHLL